MSRLPNILKNSKEEKVILCFSIIVTGKCNANCSYCHFFAKRNRQEIEQDISDELFDIYVLFLSKIKKILPVNVEVQCRFSGGEPLVLGDRLFELAKKIYDATSIKPFILTNGGLINEKLNKDRRRDYINFLYVSMENPLAPDKGAFKPELIMDKMEKYNSEKFPIIPGVVIVENKHFKDLYKICKIFYKKLHCLPTINELSYQFFTPPSKEELKDLYKNIFKIVRDFKLKTAIKLFPYISPELCYGGFAHYVIEMDLGNKYKLTKSNVGRKLSSVLNQLNLNYPEMHCKDKNCEWRDECKYVKWVWERGFGNIKPEEKAKAYCDMKKIINEAFFEALK